MHQCNKEVVGEGVIVLADPIQAVNDERLGDDRLGVAISKLEDKWKEKGTGKEDCIACVKQIEITTIMAWPIGSILLMGNYKFSETKHVEQNGTNCPTSVEPLAVRTTQCSKRQPPNRKFYPSKRCKADHECSPDAMMKVRGMECCWHNCVQLFKVHELVEARGTFQEQKGDIRRTFMYSIFELAIPDERSKMKRYPLYGKWICQRSWMAIHGIPDSSWHNWLQGYKNGKRIALHGNTGLVRPQSKTVAAKEIFEKYVEFNAENMPHKSKKDAEGKVVVEKRLPAHCTQLSILEEVNAMLRELGVASICQSTFSRLWTKHFKHVTISKTNNFAKCNICAELKERLDRTKLPSARAKVREEMADHMTDQLSCRSAYWMWRTLSALEPSEYLCIIHDKMDQQKTCLPQFSYIPKSCGRAYPLQISLTGAILHSQPIIYYGHFSLQLWSDGPDFHVGSVMRCLRNYERGYNGDLESIRASQPLFNALLDEDPNNIEKVTKARFRRSGCNEHQAKASSSQSKPRDLPRKFMLQLDNCAGQNKNRWMFAFLSYLTAVGVFERVNLGFLIPGHTHEDVDAVFGKYSVALKSQTVTNMPRLMEIYAGCTTPAPTGLLIDEVPDWKGFVEGHLADLEGHSVPLQFTFWVRDGIPIMQWKRRQSEDVWKPEEGIELWLRDENNMPKIPKGQPKVLRPYSEVDNLKITREGIWDYIKHWKQSSDDTNNALVKYWEKVHRLIGEIDTTSTELKDEWLPKSRWRKLAGAKETDNDVTSIRKSTGPPSAEEHYVGPRKGRPKYYKMPNFDPLIDVKSGQFVLVLPHDRETFPVWMGFTLSDVCNEKGDQNFKKVRVAWWVPLHQCDNVSDKERYLDCWVKKWRKHPQEKGQWLDVETILFSWNARVKPTLKSRVIIPVATVEKVKETLAKPMIQEEVAEEID